VTWGTVRAPLADGVHFQLSGEKINVSAIHNEPNSAVVGYCGGTFNITGPSNMPGLPDGVIAVKTTSDFSNEDCENMKLAVCMKGKPVFVMDSAPGGLFRFTTKPTYYICVTNEKEGTVVSATFVTNPYPVVFDKGTSLKLILNKFNKFEVVKEFPEDY